jgi:glycine/D-amino acid oxidase-like deaminating enzyme
MISAILEARVGEDYRGLSHWMATVEDDLTPRPSLPGDLEVDVAIVGAGYTGLWTAYYLSRADPGLRIAVLEAEIAGYGASGRNGGWCSAFFPLSVGELARRHGRAAAVAMHQAMVSTVDEVGRAAAAEGVDCHFAKGGTLTLARNEAQLARLRSDVDAMDSFGLGGDAVLLDAAAARDRCGAGGVLGAVYSPHCAALHPARLVRGLAHAVVRRGVRLFEQTPVTAITPHMVQTGQSAVRAEVIVRATEGYTPRLPGLRRTIAPVYSLMIATPPLPASFWAAAGLAGRETFTDGRRLIIYGQRTADGRLAFGGRGAPYHFASRIRPTFDRDPRVFAALRRSLVEVFPDHADRLTIERAWGGPLGIPRDWHASVGLDRASGLAWAGGYVGDGVATANLAGRTLADLIRGVDSDLTRLPWVGHRSRRWEPEPLRWLGANAVLRLVALADAREARVARERPVS